MRKKSHILLAGYLADQLSAAESLQAHRKAFCLGNILPDIKPSFLTTRHEYFTTIGTVQDRIRFLVEDGFHECNDRVFWRRIGEVIHYIADYFTFPHNKTFQGTFRQHNSYEKELKNKLKAYIKSGQAQDDLGNMGMFRFGSISELMEYVRTRHQSYLCKERCVADDIQYILTVCMQVVYGIFHLCTEVNTAKLAVA